MTPDPAEPLYAAVLAARADDAPRLVYADWLEENGEPERAALIRAQCAAADPLGDFGRLPAALSREAALLAEHESRWRAAETPGVPGLEWGRMRRGFVDEVSITRLADIPRPEAIRATAAVPVTTLRLGRGDLGADWPQRLREAFLRPLTHLSAVNLNAEDGQLAALAESDAWPNLTTLSLPGSRLSPAAVPLLARLVRDRPLRRLDLSDAPLLDAAALAALTGVNELRDLLLCDTALSAREAALLIQSVFLGGGLESLSAAGCPRLGRGQLEPLAGAPPGRLRRLNLSRCELDRDDASTLGRAPALSGLVSLDLSQNPIGPTGFSRLCTHWSGEALRALHLAGCDLADLETRSAAGAKFGATLQVLTLSSNNLTADQLAFLPAWLSDGPLAVLALDRNPVGDALLPRLRAAAEGPGVAALRVLDLSACRLGPAAADLLRAAARWSGLSGLRLADNPLGDAAAEAVASSPQFAGLCDLDLSKTGLTERGVGALLASETLGTLDRLRLGGNGLDPEWVEPLRERFGAGVYV